MKSSSWVMTAGSRVKTCFVIGKPSLCIRTVSIDLLYVEEKDESVLL